MPEQYPTVSVATWNVLWDRDTRDTRMNGIAANLPDLDVLCVQETALDRAAPGSVYDLASAAGMTVVAEAEYTYVAADDRPGMAVLSRLPVLAAHAVPVRARTGAEVPAYPAAELLLPSGRHLLVVSAHLPWGGLTEARRLAHAIDIDDWVTARMAGMPDGSIAVLAGDFNANPDHDTVRYLTAKAVVEGRNAQWTDVWATAGAGPGFTSDPRDNINSARTAAVKGISDASMIPPRRIDYVLVRGYAHGRPGAPLSARLFGTQPVDGLHPSDHFGVVTKLWDPPLSALS